MTRVISIILGAATVLLVAAVLTVELAMVVPAVQAGGPSGAVAPEAQNAISVSGEGKVSAEPDVAEIVIGVESRAPTAKEAASQNSEDMNEVMAVLEGMGIAEEDIQTVDYSIRVEMDYRGDEGPKVVGYVVDNAVRVKVRDLDLVGDLLDQATEAGANNIYGITFTVEDPRSFQEQAREMAVAEARSKAGQLAEAADVRLGDLLSLSEYLVGGPVYVERAAAAEGMGGGAPPISPGQLEITVQVQMSYEIVQ
ncbi:MAG: SIMPL domain-containing protein [Anaerolineae bacterium]